MDSDKEYVEVFDDEGGDRDKRGRPAQLRRYKDDAYRSATHMHACTHARTHTCTHIHTCTLHASWQSVQLQSSISTCILHHVSLALQSMPDCRNFAHALP
jgi:hypothetical protein